MAIFFIISIFQKEEKTEGNVFIHINETSSHDKRGMLCDVSSFYSGILLI